MSIHNLFNNQQQPVFHTQNTILDNKNRFTQKFTDFDKSVFDLSKIANGGFSYQDIKESLAFDTKTMMEKEFAQNFVNYIKVLVIRLCNKININQVHDSQSAIHQITSVMNEGGVESGMLLLTPWMFQCGKQYAESLKRNVQAPELATRMEELKQAFGESLATCAVAQCIAACSKVNRNIHQQLTQQAGLIKTACTYHIVAKIQIGSQLSYEAALNIFVNCMTSEPSSFKFYASFVKMFQNTHNHIVYIVGSKLAHDGIKLVKCMQNSGKEKLFEQQLMELGGVERFDNMYEDMNLQHSLMNVGSNINEKLNNQVDLNDIFKNIFNRYSK